MKRVRVPGDADVEKEDADHPELSEVPEREPPMEGKRKSLPRSELREDGWHVTEA